MKSKLIIFTFLIFFSVEKINAQWNSEYHYFSFTAGMTHSFGTIHEVGETSKSFLTNQTYEQLIVRDKFKFSYKPSINIGFNLNIDFKNDDTGLSIGLHYQNYPYKSVFYTGLFDLELSESTNIQSISLPVMFKYGKKFYEVQNYFFAGVQANYHFKGKQFYNYEFGHISYFLTKDAITGFTPSFFMGYNFHIINIKVEYLPFNMVIDSPIEIVNLSDNKGHANHFIFLHTNINIPLNSWISRADIGIEHWLRRILK